MNSRILLTSLCLILWSLLFPAPGSAGSPNKVTPMDAGGVDALMKSQDSRCLVVAVASWCSPCRKELPVLNRLHEKYLGQGVRIVALSVDADGPEAMQPVVDTLGVQFPVHWVGQNVMQKYNIFAVPTLFIIKDGKTVERIVGQRSETFLEEKIQSLLK